MTVNKHEVRAAAGVTMVVGAVAFSYAYFAKQYIPLQVVASFFFVEFLIRVTAGIRHAPLAASPVRWLGADRPTGCPPSPSGSRGRSVS
jgi:hypothetical protein